MKRIDSLGRIVSGPQGSAKTRKLIIFYNPDGTRSRGTTYARWVMEDHLKRELLPGETVDHINRDFTDDRIENLRIINLVDHVKDDAKRVRDVLVTCIWCGCKVWRKHRDLAFRAKQGKAGPFCDNVCSGKYTMTIRHGGQKLPAQIVPAKENYYRDKVISNLDDEEEREKWQM